MRNESRVPNRAKWFSDGEVSKDLQLGSLVGDYIREMFGKTVRMFEYKNLPEGITYMDMEKVTQLRGFSVFIQHEGRFYVLDGSLKDNVTWNYEPSKAILTNPALSNLKSEYELDKDAVLFKNDTFYIGLFPIMERNAILLAQTDLSLLYAGFNTRMKGLFKADDDNTKDSIDELISNVWEGKKIHSVVTEELFKNSIENIVYSNSQTNDIISLIELKQYIKANWYIELGINANYNMKREALNENELQMNDDALIPLIDDMLECRKESIEKINALWNLNISVELGSSWKKMREEMKLAQRIEESAIQENEKEEDANENVEAE